MKDKLLSLTVEFNQILRAFLSGLIQLMPDKTTQLEMLSDTVAQSDPHQMLFIRSLADFLTQKPSRLEALRTQRSMAVMDEYYEFAKADGGVELVGAMMKEISARFPTFDDASITTLWQYIDFMVNRAEEFAFLSNSPPIDPNSLEQAIKAMVDWERDFTQRHGRAPTTHEAVAHAQVLANE